MSIKTLAGISAAAILAILTGSAFGAQVYTNKLAGGTTVPAGTYGEITLDSAIKASSYAALSQFGGGEGSFANIINRQSNRVDTRTHTFGGWFKIDALDKMIYAAKTVNTGDHVGYKLAVDADGKLQIGKVKWSGGSFAWNGNVMTTANACITADTWHHIAVAITKQGDAASTHTGVAVVYVDGVAVEMAATPANFATNLDGETCTNIYMGAGVSAAGVVIDDTAIADAETIKAMATQASAIRPVVEETVLVEGNTGDTMTDYKVASNCKINKIRITPTETLPVGSKVLVQSIGIGVRNDNAAFMVLSEEANAAKASTSKTVTPNGRTIQVDTGTQTPERWVEYHFNDLEVIVGSDNVACRTRNDPAASENADTDLRLIKPATYTGMTGTQWAGTFSPIYEIKYTVKEVASAGTDYVATVTEEGATWNVGLPETLAFGDTVTINGSGSISIDKAIPCSLTIGSGVTLNATAGVTGKVTIEEGAVLSLPVAQSAALTTVVGSGTLKVANADTATSSSQHPSAAALFGFTGTLEITAGRIEALSNFSHANMTIKVDDGAQLSTGGTGDWTSKFVLCGTGWTRANEQRYAITKSPLRAGNNISGTITTEGDGLLTIGTYGGNITMSGVITAPNGLKIIAESNGVITLNASNAITGGATITHGTVKFGHDHSLGAQGSAITVDANGTVDVNGHGEFAHVVTLNGGKIKNGGSNIGDNIVQIKQLILTADSTIECGGNFGVINNGWNPTTVTFNGHKLTKLGGQEMWLCNVTLPENDTGTIQIDAGDVHVVRKDCNLTGVTFTTSVEGKTVENKNVLANAVIGTVYKLVDAPVNVAMIGGQEYDTLQAAIEAAQNMDYPTITLMSDIVLTEQLEIGGDLKLDFNGHVISGDVDDSLVMVTGEIDFVDTSDSGNGGIQTTNTDGEDSVTVIGEDGDLAIYGGVFNSRISAADGALLWIGANYSKTLPGLYVERWDDELSDESAKIEIPKVMVGSVTVGCDQENTLAPTVEFDDEDYHVTYVRYTLVTTGGSQGPTSWEDVTAADLPAAFASISADGLAALKTWAAGTGAVALADRATINVNAFLLNVANATAPTEFTITAEDLAAILAGNISTIEAKYPNAKVELINVTGLPETCYKLKLSLPTSAE